MIALLRRYALYALGYFACLPFWSLITINLRAASDIQFYIGVTLVIALICYIVWLSQRLGKSLADDIGITDIRTKL